MNRGYLKLLVFFLIWQKKTAVSLKISVIVGMKDIKSFNMPDHTRTNGITHKVEPYRSTGYRDASHFFSRRKLGVDIAI